ncbi:phage tail protein [Hahella sp. KA22]|uniref:phage tail protein n=1 Tax=Hahella sp. KA22 TaxID=1628392 RepID=UPI000FDCE722|nr:tail fiber protein [Hahella sp. KA22]AZZ94470.1 phage tail protein [Hahella sp. KA22]QAY57843.1 phage tail protein [Hahella sp. KA22]
MSEPFIAEIRVFPYSFTPAGWSSCLGQLAPIQQNPALYSLIGVIYGGDGRTTMGMPNLQGRTSLHYGQSQAPGLSPHYLGERDGYAFVQISEEQMPSHTHSLNAATLPGSTPEPQNMLFAYQQGDLQPDYKQSPADPLVAMSEDMIAYTGLSDGHENRQPYLVLRFCIALEGIYPQRSQT